jgi:hypothetical protein
MRSSQLILNEALSLYLAVSRNIHMKFLTSHRKCDNRICLNTTFKSYAVYFLSSCVTITYVSQVK